MSATDAGAGAILELDEKAFARGVCSEFVNGEHRQNRAIGQPNPHCRLCS